MSFQKLIFKPGINKDTTNYANEGGWWDGDKIRFFSGYPQKLGGWVEGTSERFKGTCRQLWNWITSFNDNLLAVGTNQKLYIEVGGYFYDITPIRETFLSAVSDNCINTTNASNVVVVNIPVHGCLTNDFVIISGVTGDVGGIPNLEINKEHKITKIDNDNFSFVVTSSATSTATGGGSSITIKCQIHPGFPSATLGYGWGTGEYDGNFGWGLASPIPVDLPGQDWFFDNFDNDLVGNIRVLISGLGAPIGGPIYIWQRGASVNPLSTLIEPAVLLSSLVGASDVPASAYQILVSQNDKHLLAFGCQPYGGGFADYDPLLIRWASQDTPQMWTPQITNSAGFLRVSKGSKIIRAIATRQEIIVLTDASVYSLQFTGTSDVFSLQELSNNTSVMSPRATASVANVVYWMGVDKFYMYDGRVQPLPTTVRDYVFKNFNTNQSDQVICGTNEGFNEVWWFYPSGNSNWNDSYVVYNYLEQVWFYGTMERTAWLDSSLRDVPLATTTGENDQDNGIFYQHETGIDDAGAPLISYIQSSDIDLQDGDKLIITNRVIPDVNFNNSVIGVVTPKVTISIRSRNFPGSQYENDPEDTQNVVNSDVDLYTKQIFIRTRARQMAVKIASDQIGTQWQLGALRIDGRSDGKR
jgi:hypothetical protein